MYMFNVTRSIKIGSIVRRKLLRNRAGGSSLVAPAMAGPLIVKKKKILKSFCILIFCAACTLSVMYNISFKLIVKMCQKLHIWASNFQKFPGGHAPRPL